MYRLLIVDTDPVSCQSIRNLLDWSRYGFSCVMTAYSFADAVSKAIDMQPHVAIADIKLGDQWGYDLASHLRSMGLRTIFCMISDLADPFYIRKAMQACAQDYLLKPVNTKELRAFIERIITRELHGTLPERAAAKQELDPVLQKDYANFSRITNKIILFVHSNYSHSHSLTSIAESFNMSSKYIGRIFLKDTGMKYSEYLMSYRMLEAKRLIINTREKISVIAGMVGYSQLNNFYTQFRDYFGVSPSSLRQFDDVHENTESLAGTL